MNRRKPKRLLIVGFGIAVALAACSAPSGGGTTVQPAVGLTGTASPASMANPQRSLETVSSPTTLALLGADISSLQRSEDLGAKFYDVDGTPGDAVQILQGHGVNAIRLRVWVDPASGYNNKAKVIAFASQLKPRGLKLLIDFHYSDTWADPGKQFQPAAWAGHSLSQLEADVYNYTLDVCRGLLDAGVTPDIVQIGNEINNGMLWPTGRADHWDNLAALLKQGYIAVKTCSPSTQVMLHIANAGDDAGARIWFDSAASHGVRWDITGLSYYSYWHGSMSAMTSTVRDLNSRYGKPVIVVETSYAFTLESGDAEENIIHLADQLTAGYEASPSGQAANLRDVIDAARAGGAIGVFYWEPTWTAVAGNGWDPANPSSGDQWENQALFDYTGKALPAINEFKP